jgi:glycosyltransferase involved in cell wall biosynthesis
MKDTHKVSIVVAIYNVEKYIAECLESIINQTYTNLEIICVNDESSDNSEEKINHYLGIDSRIRIINQKNKGLSGVRNTGIKYSTGKYIYFIDGDDFISNDYISEMVKSIEKDGCKIVHNPNYIEYLNENYHLNTHINIHNANAFKTNNITHSTWSKLFDLDFLKETKVTFKEHLLYEDYEFWNRFIAHLDDISFCEKGLYYYRQRDNSIISQSKNNKFYNNQIINCIDSIYNYYSQNKEKLNFKPLYISLINDHLYYQKRKHRLKFILETRNLLKKFDPDFIEIIMPACQKTYREFTSYRIIKLILISTLCNDSKHQNKL